MKLYFIPSLILLFALLVFGCQSAAVNNQNSAAKPQILKLNDVIKSFKDASLPLGQLEFFSAKSDPKQLLGKPNQYTEKAVWQTTEKITHTVEAFAAEADLQARKTAVENDSKSGAQPAEYVYAHKNILLRLHHEMLPETAARFEQALKAL
jgi:PBP1b-binding outer membrane lipoprotein LpoB